MKRKSKARKSTKVKPITAEELDRKFDNNEDITPWLDLKNIVINRVFRVNVDFPTWMVERLDKEAEKLNISRQAVIKMWISERLDPEKKFRL